jgi:HAD superfamily hydrolase (TIGR01509 family)
MFAEMRDALGIPKSVDILEHIHSLPSSEQETAMDKIKAIERRAMKDQTPQPGLTELMSYLDERGLQKAICTRNFDMPIEHLLTTFLPDHRFEPIITRAFKPPKPSPAGINHIAGRWGLKSAANLIMVGDSIDDMTAGHSAGAATVLLVNPANEHLSSHDHTDLCIGRLDELIEVLEQGFVGREEESEGEVEGRQPKLKGTRIRGGPNKILGVLRSAGRDPEQVEKTA